MSVFSRIAEHLELDGKQIAVVSMGAGAIAVIVGVLVWVEFAIWRLVHPDASWWAWLLSR